MGVDFKQDVLVLGYNLGTLQDLWNAIGLEAEFSNQPVNSTAKLDKKGLITLKSEFREIIQLLWSTFVEVYDAKYVGLETSGLSGYSAMSYARNIYNYGLDRYQVFFGVEVCTEAFNSLMSNSAYI